MRKEGDKDLRKLSSFIYITELKEYRYQETCIYLCHKVEGMRKLGNLLTFAFYIARMGSGQ